MTDHCIIMIVTSLLIRYLGIHTFYIRHVIILFCDCLFAFMWIVPEASIKWWHLLWLFCWIIYRGFIVCWWNTIKMFPTYNAIINYKYILFVILKHRFVFLVAVQFTYTPRLKTYPLNKIVRFWGRYLYNWYLRGKLLMK